MRALLLFVLSCSLGCSGGEAPEADPPTTTPEAVTERETVEPETAEPASPETAEPSAPEGASAEGEAEGDLCTRARACCRAYVSAIPSARRPLEERGCIEMDAVLGEAGEAAGDVCEAAIGGWRQSLQLTGIEVPPDCS